MLQPNVLAGGLARRAIGTISASNTAGKPAG
jgi:hypothetical protein